jgi:o-succinylbenzoate synthase
MPLRASVHPYILHFNFEARTSRGAMKERPVWFLKIWDSQNTDFFGLGECAPLAGLSKETGEEASIELSAWADKLNEKSLQLKQLSLSTVYEFLQTNKIETTLSSVTFAIEMALLDLMNGGKRLIFDNDFVKGRPIPINGLIWMGGLDYMLQQIDIKIRDGFSCIKMKVGSHNFEKECDILQYIRRKYYKQNIVIRLDANGAFKVDDALDKLRALARFDVHSIEQPIKSGLAEMGMICRESPVPVALDEELIGVPSSARLPLLTRLKPKSIILKPSLMGGLDSTTEWIQVAEKLGISWWVTSALESNIGLNAIAQFTAQYPVIMPQGLGTGSLYVNNITAPLQVNAGSLTYNLLTDWNLNQLFPSDSKDESLFMG